MFGILSIFPYPWACPHLFLCVFIIVLAFLVGWLVGWFIIAQATSQFTVLLTQLAECWYYKDAPPCPTILFVMWCVSFIICSPVCVIWSLQDFSVSWRCTQFWLSMPYVTGWLASFPFFFCHSRFCFCFCFSSNHYPGLGHLYYNLSMCKLLLIATILPIQERPLGVYFLRIVVWESLNAIVFFIDK